MQEILNTVFAVFIVLLVITIPVCIGAAFGIWAIRWKPKNDNVYLGKLENSDEELSLDGLKLTNNIEENNSEHKIQD